MAARVIHRDHRLRGSARQRVPDQLNRRRSSSSASLRACSAILCASRASSSCRCASAAASNISLLMATRGSGSQSRDDPVLPELDELLEAPNVKVNALCVSAPVCCRCACVPV